MVAMKANAKELYVLKPIHLEEVPTDLCQKHPGKRMGIWPGTKVHTWEGEASISTVRELHV